MAAATYYDAASSMRTDEEHLEIQARDTDQKALLLQAQSRGFLVRHRVGRPHKDDVAIDNNEHLASIDQGRYRDTHSNTRETVNERRNSNINKIINKHTEHENMTKMEINIHKVKISVGTQLRQGKPRM